MLALLLALLVQSPHSVTVEPASAPIGEPIEVVCELTIPAGTTARALAPELAPEAPWVALDHTTFVDAGRARLTWSVLGLDPEAPALPEFAYTLRDGEGVRTVTVQAGEVALEGVLAEGEDAPRPLLGLRELEDEAPAASGWSTGLVLAAAAGIAALLLVAGVLVLRRRALARRPRRDRTSFAERIAALNASGLPTRARWFELTRLVRQALDERTGTERRGWTDAEMADLLAGDDGLRATLGADACDAAVDVLRSAEAPKYAGARPTDFAVQEAFGRAERALTAVREEPS